MCALERALECGVPLLPDDVTLARPGVNVTSIAGLLAQSFRGTVLIRCHAALPREAVGACAVALGEEITA